jgi:hypothetical protein
MALDPEIVQLYADAKEAYEAVKGGDESTALDAREHLRAQLAAYILDLETNGISVPAELEAEMSALDQT